MTSIKTAVSTAFAILISLSACTGNSENGELAGASAQDTTAYVASINEWHKAREAKLKEEDGWLTLAGLFWLNEGKNTFGSAESNNLIFPEGRIAAHAGTFILTGSEVKLQVNDAAAILVDGKQVKEAVVYTSEMKDAPKMKYGSLSWYVVKRDYKYGIRLRDTESEARRNFKGIQRYPVTTAWKVEARLESTLFPKRIPITNVLGQTSQHKSPGTLVFSVDGKEHRLDALDEGDKLFVIFADKTSGTETYGAGRYLYADKPGLDGKTILDFNKATNPPCAFAPYATCPLPPRQNFLAIPIPAGEKSYEEGH